MNCFKGIQYRICQAVTLRKNMSGGILRSVLVFLLENHFVRFVVTLLMSCAYDTYSYGKDSLQNYI